MRTGDKGNVGWRALRAQSDLIAVVLLAGMVIAGATAVVIAGSEALNQGRGDASTTSAVQSMQSLDAKIQQLAQGSSSQDSIGGGANGANFDVVGKSPANPVEAGKVSVTVDPPSGPSTTHPPFWLGTVRYEKGDEVVAYQGGGVWRKTGNGSVAVSSPGIQYRTKSGPKTVNFPIVSIDGESSGSDFQVESVERKELLSTLGLSNPIKPGKTITVEIRSEYYQGWAEVLKSEFGGKPVTTDPTTNTVTVTMKAPTSANAPSAVLGTNVDGSLRIKNFGATDSYDSDSGPYPGWSHNHNANVLTRGEIEPKNKMSVRGDLIAEEGLDGTMKLSNRVEIFGRTIFGNDPDIGSGDYLKISGGTDQTFHGTFSTLDNMRITKPTSFNDDVLVDGNFKADKNKRPDINGRLVVTGNVEEIGKADISGPVYVHGDASDIASKGTVNINGDLIVYGDIEVGADTNVNGDIYYRTGVSENIDPGANYNNKIEIGTSAMDSKLANGPTPITPDVPTRGSAVTEINSWSSLSAASNNDNSGEDTIDGSDEVEIGGTSDDTIESGEYYLQTLQVASGEELKLDTSGGDIVIYVPNTPGQTAVSVEGRIKVTGSNPDNRVRIYVDDAPMPDSDPEFSIANNQEVVVPDDRSPNLWMYFKPTADVEIGNGATYQGVVYGASDTPAGGATISLKNGAKIYGALIGDVEDVPNHATVHYDEALKSRNAFTTPATVAPIGFVHFSQQTATVD